MKEEEKTNVKLEDDFKPRKWLLVVLIVMAGAIFGVLVYYGIGWCKDNLKNPFSTRDSFREKYDKTKNEMDEMYGKAKDEFDKESFNDGFEMHSGTQSGFFVLELLDDVITNNKKNKKHLITVTWNGQSSSDPEVIRSYKSNIDDSPSTKYEVIMDYDDDGYINKIEVRK